MSGKFEQIVGYASGRTDLPKLQRDQLVDDGCISLFDAGHGWGYKAQVSPIANGTSLRNYDRDTGTPAVVSGLPAWAGNMMVLASLAQVVTPGAEWQLPASNTRFVIGGYFKVPLSGYPIAGTGSSFAGVFGWNLGNGANSQYGLQVQYDKATGLATGVFLSANAGQDNILSSMPTDDLPHHFAMEFAVLTSTTYQVKFWIDGALVFTSAAKAYSGTLVQPLASHPPKFGAYYPEGSLATKCSIGRIWLWDTSKAGSKSTLDLIAADIAQNAGRFS